MDNIGNVEKHFTVTRNRGTCMFHDTHAASCRLCTAYPFIGLRLCDSVNVSAPNLGMSRVPGGKSITRYDEQHAKHSPVKTPTEYDGNHSDRNFMVTHTSSQCQCWHTGNRCSTGVPTRTPDTFVGRNECPRHRPTDCSVTFVPYGLPISSDSFRTNILMYVDLYPSCLF